MKQEIRDRWVEALRTGEQDLRSGWMIPTNPCALALCYIANNDVPTLRSDNRYGAFDDPQSGYFLGGNLVKAKWPGLYPDGVQSVPVKAVYRMSDSGVKAAEIADWIEANVPVTP